MKAWPLTVNGRRACDRAPAGAWASALPAFLATVLAALIAIAPVFCSAGAARAEGPVNGEVKVVIDGGYTRLVFRLDEAVDASVRVNGAIAVIEFKRPVSVAVDRLSAGTTDISAARIDPDGKAIRIALSRKLTVNAIPAAERYYVDLLPETWSGVKPGLPQEVVDELASRARAAEAQLQKLRVAAKPPTTPAVRVKVVKLPTFMRYVFDLPDGATVMPESADGKLVLHFDRQIKWDLADAKASMPSTLEQISADLEFDQVAVTFAFNGTPERHSFREDRSFVVDIARDPDAAAPKPQAIKIDPAAGKPIAAPKSGPAIEAPETVPAQVPQQDKAAPPEKSKEVAKETPSKPPAKEAPHGEAPHAAAPPPEPARAAAPAVKEVMQDVDKPPVKPASPPAHDTSHEVAKAVVKDVVPDVAKEIPKEIAKPVTAPQKPEAQALPPEPAALSSEAVIGALVNPAGTGLSIQFPFGQPTAAAAFMRSDMLWLVFDNAAKIDLARLTRQSNRVIRKAEFSRGEDGEGIVRIQLARPQLAALAADGASWVLTIDDTVTTQSAALTIARNVTGKGGASIVIPFEGAKKVHRILDPDFGERLLVMTALAPARGILKAQNFVELHALASTHGVVVHPIADDVTAGIEPDRITIARPGGLTLSAASVGQRPQQATAGFRGLTFDTQTWGFDREAPFLARQSELIGLAAAAASSPAKLKQARFNLARFYLAREMAAEAKGVLDVAGADPRSGDEATSGVLKAVADIMLDRPEEALKELAIPQIADQQDASIWRAIAHARRGMWQEAHAGFKTLDLTVHALPIELQRMAMQSKVRSEIEMRDLAGAARTVDEFETMGIPDDLEPAIAVLTGRLYESQGRKDEALTSYRAAAASKDRRSAAQGRLREIALLLENGDMPQKEAIHELETLTTVWRGDETETEGLRLLAHLYTEDNRYRDAFHVMRTALRAHPNSDQTRKIQDEAAKTFDSLFLAGKGEALPPVEALGLFYDFRELTPIGRRGDEMIRRLADRLVTVDLLDQAAELLQHQVDNRLRGAARAQVATKLAIVYLMNHKPDLALATLQKTRTAELSNELRDQRLLLEGRAISDTGRHELALEVIADIKGREAVRLRADIMWAEKRWREAGEQIELMHGDRWRDFTPLSDGERADILRAAIAYSLADEQLGLQRLREKYAAKMADGPDRLAFDVVSLPIGTGGADFKTIASKVSATDTLDAFLRDLRVRYPDQPVPVAALAKEPPKPAPAKAAPPKAEPPKPAAAKTEPAKTEAPKVDPKADSKADPKPVPPVGAALPPKPPAGVPLKPDATPTGSVRPRVTVR